MALHNLTDEKFEKDVLNAGGISCVQFSATWCNPCRILKPIMTKISDEMSDEIKFFYMDIDSQPNTASRLAIRGVPTLIVFDKQGEVLAKKVGATTEANVLAWLKSLI